jgi:hypothetical protein
MIILKEKNILEIVTYMLNFEHNCTKYEFDETAATPETAAAALKTETAAAAPEMVVTPDGLKESSTVTKFPIITTKNGKKLHYKSTCGIIYYNSINTENLYPDSIIELMTKIYEIISKYEDHLLVDRVTAVTGSCVVKQNIFMNGTYMIKAKKPYIFSKKNIRVFPARALIMLPNIYEINFANNCPPHYSTRASFTWYFMPIQYNLFIGGINSVNTVISSIYLDCENKIKYNHRDAIYHHLTYSDFTSVNTIDIVIDDKFILYSDHGLCKMLCVGPQRIPALHQTLCSGSQSKLNKIKTYDDIEYVNNEKKCNSCDKELSNFSIGIPLEYNDTIPMVSLLCVSCWSYKPDSRKKNYFIFSSTAVQVNKVYSKIIEITQENFIKMLSCSNQNIDLITRELSKFPPTYNILFTNLTINHIIDSIANFDQYIIMQIRGYFEVM